MTEEVKVSTTVDASAEQVFNVLADPTAHAAIDGSGWVREPVDGAPLTATGQMFRMGMYHDNHPNKHYEMANRVEVFDRPHAIAWQPGAQARHIPGRTDTDDDTVEFGGWFWRYDLEPEGAGKTKVTLTYDWSAVPEPREMEFPPFPVQHLENSLANLAKLAVSGR